MSTFLQVSGAIFWLSLGAGGLWVGLCYASDWLKRRKKHSPPVLILESHPIGKRIVDAWQFTPRHPAAIRDLTDAVVKVPHRTVQW